MTDTGTTDTGTPAVGDDPAVFLDDAAVFLDDPSVADDPAQEAPATDNTLRPEDGPQDLDLSEDAR